MLNLAVGVGVDLRTGIGGDGLRVAKAGGQESSARMGAPSRRDLGVGMDDVGVAEGEGLGDGEIALRVLEGEGVALKGAACGGHVEGAGELFVQGIVVGVKREGITEVFGGTWWTRSSGWPELSLYLFRIQEVTCPPWFENVIL